eukprot:11537894-Ditylum_brightwellii.AAC.1
MAAFILNPYDGDIGLSTKEGRKLYDTGCTGVKKEQIFGGSNEKFSNFLKLIEHRMNELHMMEALAVSVAWDAAIAALQNPSK